ncbi:HalOD1 output domain-containing protein [Haloterrigena alkaliphila]|uniref:HalOD1 output domain-containing protein n=1 Tax=Haloterrigena alkaliphila TaxID=2816475 RepID=UPI001CFF6BBB|nr:HalOD1 output domain-containing protein [Haloterrigena alkaliphila]UHQ95170.1 hypothetical protein J0X25_20220 [Haloterrigena alkaliphila]
MTDTESTRSKPSLRVLEAIAGAEGVSPTALEPPLNDVVDPAALDRLFEPTATNASVRGGHVSFRYRGYDVTISSDGTIELS